MEQWGGGEETTSGRKTMNSCCRSSPVTLEFEAIRRKDDRGVPPLTLLWNIEDIEYLRRHCRIPLSAIGQLNQGGHQRAKEGTLPCMIQPIEACLAIEYGFAIAVARTDRGTKKLEKETPREALLDILQCDRRSYLVYRDLWEQGFHLTSGLKFGGEFLAYEGKRRLSDTEKQMVS